MIAHCQHVCKHVLISTAHMQGAGRLGSDEDPGHDTSIFPTPINRIKAKKMPSKTQENITTKSDQNKKALPYLFHILW